MRPPRPDDPSQIGGYRVLARLGAGGMGNVYLARSAGGRTVAIKVVRPELTDESGFRERFRREVAAARRVSGPYTAAVADADPDAEIPWLATEYVAGPALGDAVTTYGPLPETSVRALASGLAEALQAVHGADLVHRDVKPSNVLLAVDGPRLIDFGISRATGDTSLTSTGLVVGSPGYMSPEQADSLEIGPPSDLFSLASVLVFAATGQGPFGSGPTPSLLYRIVHTPPNLDAVPDSLRPLVEPFLAKDPTHRPTAPDLIRQAVPEGADTAALTGTGWLPPAITYAIAQRSAELLNLDAGTGVGTDAAAGPGSRAGTEAGAGPGMEPGAVASAGAAAVPDAGAGPEAGPRADLDAGAGPGLVAAPGSAPGDPAHPGPQLPSHDSAVPVPPPDPYRPPTPRPPRSAPEAPPASGPGAGAGFVTPPGPDPGDPIHPGPPPPPHTPSAPIPPPEPGPGADAAADPGAGASFVAAPGSVPGDPVHPGSAPAPHDPSAAAPPPSPYGPPSQSAPSSAPEAPLAPGTGQRADPGALPGEPIHPGPPPAPHDPSAPVPPLPSPGPGWVPGAPVQPGPAAAPYDPVAPVPPPPGPYGPPPQSPPRSRPDAPATPDLGPGAAPGSVPGRPYDPSASVPPAPGPYGPPWSSRDAPPMRSEPDPGVPSWRNAPPPRVPEASGPNRRRFLIGGAVAGIAAAGGVTAWLLARDGGGGGGTGAVGTSTGEPTGNGAGVGTSNRTTYTIGLHAARTGVGAEISEHVKNGVELAVKQANEAGGNRFLVELWTAYDESADSAVQVAAQQLTERAGVVTVIGPVLSATARVATPIYEKAGLPSVTPTATSPLLTASRSTSFNRAVATDATQGADIGAYLAQQLKVSDVYLVHDVTESAVSMLAAVHNALTEAGVRIVGSENAPAPVADYTGIAARVTSTAATAVFFSGSTDEAARFAAKLTEVGYAGIRMGGELMFEQRFAEAAGAAADGWYIAASSVDAATEGRAAEFAAAYQRAYNAEPPMYAAEGYDVANLVIAAIKKLVDSRTTVDRTAMLNAVRTARHTGVAKNYAFDFESGEFVGRGTFVYQVHGRDLDYVGAVDAAVP